jgi:hypothetical protein
LLCAGQTIQPGGAARVCRPSIAQGAVPTADDKIVTEGFEAHLKNNPKLRFTNKWTTVRVSQGKPSNRNWQGAEYSIKKVGPNEYVLRYTRSWYKQSIKSINWRENKTRYYVIKVSVDPSGKQKYIVKKYKGYFRGHERTFTFTANTKAGRVLVPAPRRNAVAGARPQAPKITNYRCSITAVNRTKLMLGSVLHSKNYSVAVKTQKGLYYIKATYDAARGKYFITHSKKYGGTWTRHYRRNPAPAFIRQAFNYACRREIKANQQK